ncbi:hypothetical protein EV1_040098 [Malus domestica]
MSTTMAAEAYSSAKKIKKLKYELVALKRSNIFAPTFLQLETVHKEIVELKTRLDAIQVKYDSVEKEIGHYIPQIQDLERAISGFHFVAFAKDEKLIVTYNQVIHFKNIADKLEHQVLELQGVQKINKSPKKEVDELQRVCVGLLEKKEQLKCYKVGLEALLV